MCQYKYIWNHALLSISRYLRQSVKLWNFTSILHPNFPNFTISQFHKNCYLSKIIFKWNCETWCIFEISQFHTWNCEIVKYLVKFHNFTISQKQLNSMHFPKFHNFTVHNFTCGIVKFSWNFTISQFHVWNCEIYWNCLVFVQLWNYYEISQFHNITQ